MMIASDGTLGEMVKSGARILESACGFCIGNHQSPGSHGISLRTSNRNFEGRSGTKDGQLYLVSPETAALAAIYGRVVDPLSVTEIKAPEVTMPEHFIVDDTDFIFPPEKADDIVIKRGPNIGAPPLNVPLRDTLKGEAAIKVGEKITTDHIMPAGARLKYRSNIPTYSTFVFEGVDKTFSERALKNKENGKANFIVAGASYGQGSSREHAAICPMYLGVKAVIAVSIERIHQANLCNFGILPLTFRDEKDYEKIEEGDELEIDGVQNGVAKREIILKDKTKGLDIALDLNVTEKQAGMLLAGGELNLIKGE
jgi:Aconitase A